MENDDIVIRKVEDMDFDNLIELYNEVWPAKVGENEDEHYKTWATKARFVLKKSTGVSYLAEKNGKIIGSRTSFFVNAYYGQRKLNCVQFADSCVAEEYRGKHLFLRLNEAFLNSFFHDIKGELIYNISVEASRKAYEKLGWVYIKSLIGLRKYTSLLSTLWKLRFNIKKLSGAPVWDTETKIIPLDEKLLNARETEMLKYENIHVKYDVKTFQWRMESKNGIKMVKRDNLGCVVYKYGKKPHGTTVMLIGEVFLYNYTRKNFKTLLNACFKEVKPEIVLANITLGHPLFNLYKSLGFKVSKEFANHGVKVLSDEMERICLNPENWAISFMDIDTF